MKLGQGALLVLSLAAILAAGCSASTAGTEEGYPVAGKPALLYFYTEG